MRGGLEAIEIREALGSKLDALMPNSIKHGFKTELHSAKKLCVKSVTIKPKTTNPGELDKRRRGNVLYKKVVQRFDARYPATKKRVSLAVPKLAEQDAAPKKLKEQTEDRGQGVTVHHKEVNHLYHDDQVKVQVLLHELLDIQEEIGESKSPEELCVLVDALSVKLSENLTATDKKSNLLHANKLILLCDILGLCEGIVMGRQIVDWEVENDLMSEDEWKTWRNHVQVISFVTMLTVLLMSFIILKQEEKFKDAIDNDEKLEDLVGDIFELYGWNWSRQHCKTVQSNHGLNRFLLFWNVSLSFIFVIFLVSICKTKQ